MEFEERKKIPTALDIAPLIDIVFLLIIFFMLTANFIMQPGIKVKLPASETASAQEHDRITVHITSADELFINGRPVDMAGLGRELSELAALSPGSGVVLKADGKVDLALAVRVMDIARKAGSGSLVISTEGGEAK